MIKATELIGEDSTFLIFLSMNPKFSLEEFNQFLEGIDDDDGFLDFYEEGDEQFDFPVETGYISDYWRCWLYLNGDWYWLEPEDMNIRADLHERNFKMRKNDANQLYWYRDDVLERPGGVVQNSGEYILSLIGGLEE